MNNKTLQKITLPTLALLLAGAVSTQAQLIAYDGFGYTPGSQLNGLTPDGSGGYGWGTTWSATSAALSTNTAISMGYSGLTETTAGSVLVGNPEGPTGTSASSQRLLTANLGSLATHAGTGDPSGTIWISMLYQNLRDDQAGMIGFREAKLALFQNATANANGTANVNGNEMLDIGSPNTYNAGADDTLSIFQGSTYVSSGIATPRGSDPLNTVFLLMRLDVDATSAADTAYAWFNPDISSEPDTGTAIVFNANNLSSVNALRLQAGNANSSGTNAIFLADELRVGYDFNSVIPEPSVFALAGLGFFALIARRRMNK